jgi:RimJ/RimL family protein N-acetyltransferase
MESIWTGELVRLRGREPDDHAIFTRFHDNSADQRNGGIIRPPLSPPPERVVPAGSDDADTFGLTIETVADGVTVGGLATQNSDSRFGNFGYGISIGREYQRRGYAREAVTLLLRYMFGECRYHKCEVSIYSFNVGSLALHQSLGFQEEGLLREHVFCAGRYHDMILMGITANEFARNNTFYDV